MTFQLIDFIRESNRIEGLLYEPTSAEILEYRRFMELGSVEISDLVQFVKVYQPEAMLRRKAGMNVIVGNHRPPAGGKHIVEALQAILDSMRRRNEANAFETHQLYEKLHPFTDGNGRSGRMLWMWQMQRASLGFLHTWYYQSLSNWRTEE